MSLSAKKWVQPYPLKFVPQFKERVWGGRALERFGFSLPEGRIGEAWLLSEHPNGATAAANGELAGLRLDEVKAACGEDWLGTRGVSAKTGRFPLLVKLLDCSEDLSVQVHPNDEYGRLAPGELGKTEMWYVLEAKPGASIIYGLREGVTRDQLAAAIASGRIVDCLRKVTVKAGDTFYIPAGTVHALGAGVVVAEIQQNSDTTYRLYDYNRPGLDGKLRELHVEDSLEVIAYEGSGATAGQTGLVRNNEWLRLADCPYFIVEKGRISGEWPLSTSPESFTLIIGCGGSGAIRWAGGTEPLQAGDCFLLPATLGAYALTGDATVLRCYVP